MAETIHVRWVSVKNVPGTYRALRLYAGPAKTGTDRKSDPSSYRWRRGSIPTRLGAFLPGRSSSFPRDVPWKPCQDGAPPSQVSDPSERFACRVCRSPEHIRSRKDDSRASAGSPPANRPAPPAQRSAPHRLQGGRRPVPARRRNLGLMLREGILSPSGSTKSAARKPACAAAGWRDPAPLFIER